MGTDGVTGLWVTACHAAPEAVVSPMLTQLLVLLRRCLSEGLTLLSGTGPGGRAGGHWGPADSGALSWL